MTSISNSSPQNPQSKKWYVSKLSLFLICIWVVHLISKKICDEIQIFYVSALIFLPVIIWGWKTFQLSRLIHTQILGIPYWILLSVYFLTSLGVWFSHPITPYPLFWLVIWGPISEELLFRGIIPLALYPGKQIPYPTEMFKILTLSFIFWMFHASLRWDFWSISIQPWILGLCCQYLFSQTRNLLPTILLHMMANFFASSWDFYFKDFY